MSKCPCCGSDVSGHIRPLVSLDTNKLMAGAEIIKLAPREAEFMSALVAAMPMPLRHERIISIVYGAQDLGAPEKSIQVYICKLRKKIKKTGLSIRTVWGTGYALEYAGADRAATIELAETSPAQHI